MRALVGRGARAFDFLGDDMAWKRDWTRRSRAHAWRYVFRPTPFGRALRTFKFVIAPTVKRLLSREETGDSDGESESEEA